VMVCATVMPRIGVGAPNFLCNPSVVYTLQGFASLCDRKPLQAPLHRDTDLTPVFHSAARGEAPRPLLRPLQGNRSVCVLQNFAKPLTVMSTRASLRRLVVYSFPLTLALKHDILDLGAQVGISHGPNL
jgi:hypothetical protein